MSGEERTDLSYFKEYTKGISEATKSYRLIIILTNLFWCIALSLFILLAYCWPTEYSYSQEQDFDNHYQGQYVEESR